MDEKEVKCMINTIYIKNLRGFKELSKTKIRRLTLLLGENSSGKTTFLGAYNALAKLLYSSSSEEYNPFNQVPFDFGEFQNFIHKDTTELLLGGSVQVKNTETLDVEYIFNHQSKTDLTEKIARFKFNDDLNNGISLNIKKEEDIWELISNNCQFKFHSDVISQEEISSWLSQAVSNNLLPYHGDVKTLKIYEPGISSKGIENFNKIVQILRKMPLLEEKDIKVIALPPTHFESQRYYKSDPLENNEDMQQSIEKIGRKTNLFSNIHVKKSGNFYELLVKVFNSDFNIKDVGYGVSSILPFFKKLSSGIDEKTVFLLQQPEIHLHPSAQAKMTQLLAESKSHFLIETHSDYILKRLCICIMKGIIKPDELQILYFKQKTETNTLKIHEINVDKDGNLINPPKDYGAFFLKESDDFLGFK